MAEYLSGGSSPSVILKDSATWDVWLANIESIALSFEVWDLCNPELEVAPKALEEPEEPDIDTIKEKHKEDWFPVYQAAHIQWTSQYTDVHRNYQPAIIDYQTPWALLRHLRQKFATECDPTKVAKLRQLWRTLDRGLHRNTDIEKWLSNWETVQARLTGISPMASKPPTKGVSPSPPWHGHEEAKPTNEERPFDMRPCLCGGNNGRHSVWKCWEVYDEFKLVTYERNQALKQKWERAMKANPSWKAWVEKKRQQKSQAQSQRKAPQQANATFDDQVYGFFSTEASKPTASKLPLCPPRTLPEI
ncbi:hypothetical protein PITC_090550 [Penicillium italicum]|uniref:Uncharacterized protein n=1 Tax=Penicillium italicum TaxID=40296 RepID=A0A0A2LC01_PENIT|nr:hypothetical protein PITC_090550 [Penicillium italicum]